MKIQMLTTAVSQQFTLKKDKQYTVIPELGKSLIKAGRAVEIYEELENATDKQVMESRTLTPKKNVPTAGRRRTGKARK